jgi:hypothetical protein
MYTQYLLNLATFYNNSQHFHQFASRLKASVALEDGRSVLIQVFA